MGDQEAYSALGEPRRRMVNDWVYVLDPPPLPRHPLRMVNWARANRGYVGNVFWYLVFPFTLVNLAGRMAPQAPGAAAASRAAAVLPPVLTAAGLLLTISQVAWVVVFLETVLRNAPDFGAGNAVGVILPGMAGAAGFLFLIWRRWRAADDEPGEGPVPWFLTLAHAGTAAGAGLFLGLVRPAQLQYSGWPSSPGPAASGGVLRLDAMALWLVISIVLTALLALVLVLASWAGRTPGPRDTSILALAGFVLMGAVLLQHTVSALLRLAADNLLSQLAGLFWADRMSERTADQATLLAYDNPGLAGDNRLDLFPILAAVLVLAFILVLIAVHWLRPGGPAAAQLLARKERSIWWQRLLFEATRTMPVVLPIAGVLGFAAVAALIAAGEGNLGGPWFGLAELLIQLGAAAVVLAVFLGQLSALREIMGIVADLAGFWPVRDHPLAGSSYRRRVLAGLSAEIARHPGHTVALVTHSQGSVICAWLIAHPLDGNGRDWFLVSCGSPLESIYRRCFPRYFDDAFFRAVADNSAGWANFWRATDPVGRAVPEAYNELLPDPGPDGVLRGHSDYWSEPRVHEYVAALAP